LFHNAFKFCAVIKRFLSLNLSDAEHHDGNQSSSSSSSTSRRHVHIVSKLDRSFFEENLPGISTDSYSSHVRCLDAGALQSHPLAVDMEATLKFYVRDIFPSHDDMVATEVEFLKNYGVELVLVDATPIACTAGKAAGVKTVILSNFTWDYIYQDMLSMLTASSTVGASLPDNVQAAVEQCNRDYLAATDYVQLPGATPIPSGVSASKVLDAPLLCRRSSLTRAEVFAKYSIHFPLEAPMLVLSFGGHASDNFMLRGDMLPPSWNCVVLGGGWVCDDSHRFQFLPRDTFVPDVFSAADVVLGKIGKQHCGNPQSSKLTHHFSCYVGYGTVSECVSAYPKPTPLIYVPRSGWPEEIYLINYIVGLNCGVCMSPESFLAGSWRQCIEDAMNLCPCVDDCEVVMGSDAADEILKWVGAV
jgi:L-arabinokinase